MLKGRSYISMMVNMLSSFVDSGVVGSYQLAVKVTPSISQL
ncbi:hypothetical protein ACQKPX_21915 [Photobacterium sp. DNB23_23_1]